MDVQVFVSKTVFNIATGRMYWDIAMIFAYIYISTTTALIVEFFPWV